MLRDFKAEIRSVAIAAATLAALGIAPLSACGVKGPLKLPPQPAATPRPSEAPAAPVQQTPAEADAPQPPATRP